MKKLLLTVLIGIALLCCRKEQSLLSVEQNTLLAGAENFRYDETFTRTSISQSDDNGLRFAWGKGDVIGVIPLDGKTIQSNYEIDRIESDPHMAIFDGGEWALKYGRKYAAYYPFSKEALNSGEKIVFSFLSQSQNANNSMEHVGRYDYMYAPAVVASSDLTSFSFRHLVSLVRLQITVPQSDEYTEVKLESDRAWFASSAELSLSDGNMTPIENKNVCTIALDEIPVLSDNVLTVWFVMLPTKALIERKLMVTLNGRNTHRDMEISDLKSFEAGKAYSLSCSSASGHGQTECVDLGLSVKWASCNLGANAPEEYGDYYAWGEVEPYYFEDGTQLKWKENKSAGYAWSSYSLCEGSSVTMTKYCTDEAYGTIDGKAQLLAEDDASTKELGKGWRMPTGAQFQELLDRCTSEWTKLNGVNGLEFTGPSGNSIFLPATGYRTGTGLYLTGLYGYYWSSTLSSNKSCNAYTLYFSQYIKFTLNNEINNRCYGQTIRPVCD